MPITLPVAARADERSFKQVADRAEGYFAKAGKDASGSFTKAFGAGAKDARKAADGYAKALDSVADATGKATVAEKARQDALDKSKAAAKKAEDAEDQLKAARKSGDAKAVATAENQLTRAREAQTRATTAVVKSAEAASAAKRRELREVREATTAYRNLEQAQTGKGPGFLSGITSQSSGVVGQFSNLGGLGGKAFIGGAVAALAGGALIAAGAKAAGMVLDGFKSVMETGIDFSKTVNNFQGVTGASAAQSQQMASAARALGADTSMAGVSASDAAKAMTELAKAGFSVDQAIASARGTMQLATAAQIDAAQAAEIQANAINAFGMSAQDAGRVADVLANAANASSAGIPDLGLALQQVGGIAKGFGEDIEGTVAALGMLANAGVKGSDAGTLLKTTLQSITKQGEPAQQAMQALGMSLYDAGSGQFVGFREMFRQLDEAKKRMSPEQFQAETNILFGSDAMRSAMLGSVAAFDKMESNIGRVGTAAAVAEAQMRGWPGVVEGIENSTESLKLAFYDLFNTPAGQELGTKLVDGFAGVVDWVNAHKPELLSFVAQVGDTAMAVGDSMMGMDQVWLQTAAMLSDGLAYTIGTALEGLMKAGNLTGKVLSKVPGMWGDVGRSLMDVTQDVDDFVDGWQSAGGTMRATAAMITPMRDGLKDMRTGFKESMADAVASEEVNRQWAQSFDAVKGSLEAIPNSHEMVIKDNTDEVRAKLEGLGFHIQSLPDGRQVIRVDYRDSSGNPVSPQMMSRMMGFDVQSFDSAGDAQRARRGLPFNSPGSAPTPPAQVPYGPGGAWTPSSSDGGGSSSSGGPDIAVPYAAVPGLMPGVAMDAGLFSQQTAVADARTKVAEKEAKLNALLADNNASATDILNARNELDKANRDKTEAEMRFTEAQLNAANKTTKQLGQMTSDLGEVGASIDQDFGISKGLAGIAENITKFIANLAMAPLMGQLSAVAKANPTQGGHGLMGMLGASGVFGSQYQNNQYAGQGYAGGYAPVAGSAGVQMYGALSAGGSYGLPKGVNSGGYGGDASVFPDWVHQVAETFGIKPSTYPGHQSDNRQESGYAPNPQGLNRGIDWTGPVGNLQRFAEYLETIPQSMEQVIWQNPNTGRKTGIGGRQINPGYYPQSTYDEHGGNDPSNIHVHTRQSSPIPLPSASFGPASYGPTSASFGPASYGPTSASFGPASYGPTSYGDTGGGGGGGMGTGVGPGFAPAPSAAPTRIGGLAPVGGSGSGGIGIQSGGLVDMAIQAGGMGLDMMAPGAGQAAQMGIKLGARAAEYAGQAAGIGVQGLMETFLPTGGSELANSNWLTRIAGGLAGAAPALPNMAGKGQGGNLENPNGEQGGQQQGGQNPGLNIEKLEYNNNQATEDRAGKDLTYHLGSMYAAPGM